MSPVALKSVEFRRERQATWTELEGLVAQVERRGLKSLGPASLARLPSLYRATLSSLSVARAISLDRNVVLYLEALAGRAYFCVYGTRRSLVETVVEFFARRFPSTVRRLSRHAALAALFLLLGVAAGWVLTAREPERFHDFVGEAMAGDRGPEASTETLRAGLYDREERAGMLWAFSTFLTTHNAHVGILAFALGFAAGLPVFLLLFVTGAMLGAFCALFDSRGLLVDFLGWVLPHGVTELLAVVLCGAGGLAVAQALVFPGRRSRLESLALAGRDAGVLVVGSFALFLVAGFVEGVFRQTVTDAGTRYALATATAVAWVLYFGRAGRRVR